MNPVFYYNTFRPYFRRLGLSTPGDAFYAQAQLWDSWYHANVPGFHKYRIYLGKGRSNQCQRRSLGMAKKLCEDVADFLLNERVSITAGDERTTDYLQEVLTASDFWGKGNEYQERKAATGTAAYIPYIDGARTAEDGSLIGGSVRIRYASAPRIFPTTWDGGKITEVVFAFPIHYKNKHMFLMERHALEAGEEGRAQYVIYHDVITECGSPVPEAVWREYPPMWDIEPVLYTGSDQPQFAIDRLAITNNLGREDNPMGLPIYANSLDILAKLDTEYDSYDKEFVLGRKRLFVSPEFMSDENGNLCFDANDLVFYSLPEDFFGEGENGKREGMREVNMSLRVEEHAAAINQDLNLLSLKAGFGTQYYRFDKLGMATATQVISENSDLYRTIRKHEVPLAETLKTLCRAIIRLGIATGRTDLDPEADIAIRFDDSIIEDTTSERAQDRQDVAMGVMSLPEYRAKWYGETLEEAEKKLPDQLQGSEVLI